MKKKVLPIFIVLLALLMAGCGAQEKEKTSAKSSTPSKTASSDTQKEKKVSLSIGSTVSLSEIQKYTKDKNDYEVYAIKKNGKDEFTVISTEEAEPAFVDHASGDKFLRVYPSDREFMLNLDESELVAFTNKEPVSSFPIAYDLTYFAPITLSTDLSQMYLGSKDNAYARQLFTESLTDPSISLPTGESFDTSTLKLNGTAISDIKPILSIDDTEFAYYDGQSDRNPGDWTFIHTGFTKELTLEYSIGTKNFEATLKPAIGFFGCNFEGDGPAFSYSENADGYYVYDFTSDAELASKLVKSCGVIDEEDRYSRFMIGDQSVLGFTSSNVSDATEVLSNASGKTQIEISWNKSTVTFWDDPSSFDIASSEVVMPTATIEGTNWESCDPDITGDIYTEFFTIPDPDEYVHIIFEPDAPTNNCPLDTVVVKIIHPDGTIESFNGADRMVRGQTGIWYIDVYEQGN